MSLQSKFVEHDKLVFTFLFAALLAAPSVFATKAQAKRSHRVNNTRLNCSKCHQTTKHALNIDFSTINCSGCHADVSDQQSKKPIEQTADITSLKKPKDENAGMVLSMYYDKSRLGKSANKMVLIPGGEFIMGTNDRLPDESPEYHVTLPAYYIDKYEVTNLQYKQFIDATNRKSPEHFRNRTFPDGKADHPVTNVTWFDADAYCKWRGERLPTEEEWEKAARGKTGRPYPWGDNFEVTRANTPQRWQMLDQPGDTTPVGSFPSGVSPYGIYDMSGNVWEWTASWYTPHPGNTHITENYGEKYKVLKGGSWWDCTFYKCGISAPSYNRSFFLQSTENKSFGFRCAKNAS